MATRLVEVVDNGPGGGLSLVDIASFGATNPLLVAPSDASSAIKAICSYVCTGTNDDVTINAALAALPFEGGVVKLMAGNFFLGSGASSFIYGVNTKGGITLQGSGRRQGSIIRVPAGTLAPCAIKMGATNQGSQTLRDMSIFFTDPTNTYCHGVWMQTSEGQVYDVVVSNSSGHGFLIDGESTTVNGTPSVKGTSGCVRNCEAQYAGSGATVGTAVAAGDGFVVTNLAENYVLTDCFVNGGTGSAGGTLTAGLTSGTPTTTLSVSPLTGAFTNGDLLVIESIQTSPPTRQIIQCAADAAVGATTVTVVSFTPSISYQNSQNVYVCNYTKMKTRAGFRVDAFSHLHDDHPYFCYMTGLWANVSSVAVVGGEYETNGWTDMNLQGSLTGHLVHTTIQGIHTYGVKACASIFAFGQRGMVLEGNRIDGDIANHAVFMQSCNSNVVASNNIINGTTNRGGNYGLNMQSCDSCAVTGNTIDNDLTPGGSRIALNIFACTNMNVHCNSIKTSSGTALSNSSTTGSRFTNNLGYNPVGVVSPAVPASASPVAAALFDRTFYITAGTGSTTVAISGGPTITLTPSALNTVRVPASATLTPTYSVAPTWVVEGE